MSIGDKIKIQRKRLGLTQTELGEKLGVKTNAVSKWECNRVEDIPTSKIKAMAALFEVPPSYLIDDDEPDENKPAEPELDELDKELLSLAAQLTPEQKQRQIETLRDIVGRKDT